MVLARGATPWGETCVTLPPVTHAGERASRSRRMPEKAHAEERGAARLRGEWGAGVVARLRGEGWESPQGTRRLIARAARAWGRW